MYGTKEYQLKAPLPPREIHMDDSEMDNKSPIEEHGEWIPNQSNWILDFSDIARAVMPVAEPLRAPTRHQLRELKAKTIENLREGYSHLKTLYIDSMTLLTKGLKLKALPSLPSTRKLCHLPLNRSPTPSRIKVLKSGI
jgi:hypothetical protein